MYRETPAGAGCPEGRGGSISTPRELEVGRTDDRYDESSVGIRRRWNGAWNEADVHHDRRTWFR